VRNKRIVRWFMVVCAAALLGGGCEDFEEVVAFLEGMPLGNDVPVADFAGGALLGTWEFHEGHVRLADAPAFTSVKINRESVESEGLFARIAFFESGTCMGEFINDGKAENFTGEYDASDNVLKVDYGGQAIEGIYGIKDGKLLLRAKRTDEGVTYEVTLVLKPAAQAIEEPEPEPDPEDADSDGGGSPRGGNSTFLWKPKSENDGKLVTIHPWKYRSKDCPDYEKSKYKIEGLYIEGGVRDGDEPDKIYWPEGRNGNRVHVRWDKTGEKYGEDFKVVMELKNEDDVSWKIKKGSKRQEIK